ncbi:carboxymuconolactone decarboxylase family protein [Nocardioides sp. L-11A]|uniref:carboxymuconolactone decarboxylase family protein n=1 Tax=Nocardioides sp. L-11A TaxID=3043848 RepID=UPI002499FE9D|nr:carboxymuconolactone decarboxylase family protein [Nocardioides sp. L-11A]
MSARLASLRPEDLDQDQRAVYDAIAGGDRAKGVQHFPLAADDGSLNGPFGIMLHAPGVGAVLQELGATIRYRTDLTTRSREIAILLVAQASGSEFEWWAHERVGRAAGLTDEELMQLSMGRFAGTDQTENAVAALSVVLLTSATVSEEEYAAAEAVLTERQIVEVTTLVGYYRLLAQLMTVFDIRVPGGEQEPPPAHRHAH